MKTRGKIVVLNAVKGINEMNEEYPYAEELKLSADSDMFDEYRFRTGVEDRLYEAASEQIAAENPAYAAV